MISLPSVFPQHSAKPKLFFPLLPSKLFLPSTYNMWYYMLKFGIFLIRLIYLINLLRLEEFFGISQIWTASDSNNGIKWVENDIHVIESILRPCPGNEKNFWTSCSRNPTTNVWPNGFLILKKANEVWKSWDLSKSHDIICGACGKKLRRFWTICHVRCLQTEVSQKMNRSIENDPVRFGFKVMVELGFDFRTFCIGNREHRLIHV